MTPTEQAQSAVRELAIAGAKAAPAVSVSAWYWVLNLPVEKWVSIAVLVFTVLQILILFRDKVLRDPQRKTRRVRK